MAFVTLEVIKRSGKRPEDIRVAVQGFGNVGSVTAKALAEAGCKIVAISDVSGGYASSIGIDIPRAIEYVKKHPAEAEEAVDEDRAAPELITNDGAGLRARFGVRRGEVEDRERKVVRLLAERRGFLALGGEIDHG